MEITALSRQWSTRPDDQRYTSLVDMSRDMHVLQNNSQSKVLRLKDLTAVASLEDKSNSLEIVGPTGKSASITNWAFNQLCARSEIPAGYIASLPAELASQNINHGISKNHDQDIGLLVTRYPENENAISIRAVTGDKYTRISNASIVDRLIQHVGNGIDGVWRVPGEFGKPVTVTKANTTMFASDRDMYVGLVDEENRIELPNRRDGQTGTLARGFLLWNSEVGSQTFGLTTFLFDFVCANRIIWGAQNVVTFKRKHTKTIVDVWESAFDMIDKIERMSSKQDHDALTIAASYRIVDMSKTITNESETDRDERRASEARDFLKSKLALPQVSNKLVDGITTAFVKAEQRPILTLWDCTTAVTEYAKTIPFQDERVKLEVAGGKLLNLTPNN